jgi:hypothetical protein
MCVTDLDLDLGFAEDEQPVRPFDPGQRAIGSQHPGVAWGWAVRHDEDPAEAEAAAQAAAAAQAEATAGAGTEAARSR